MTIQITKLTRGGKYLSPKEEEDVFTLILQTLEKNGLLGKVIFVGRSRNIHAIAKKNLRGDLSE